MAPVIALMTAVEIHQALLLTAALRILAEVFGLLDFAKETVDTA
jgi:hypothetical protein